MKRTILAAAAFLIAGQALASNWVPVGNVAEGKIFIDLNTVKHKGAITEFWEKIILMPENNIQQQFNIVNCADKTIAMTYASLYAFGRLVESKRFPMIFDPISPSSLGEAEAKIACNFYPKHKSPKHRLNKNKNSHLKTI